MWRSSGQKYQVTDVATVAAAAVLDAKLTKLRWRRPFVVRTRMAIAWLIQFAAMGIFLFYSLIIALKFGEGSTRLMIGSWVLAYGCTFAIIEPVQVLLLSLLPCLFVDSHSCGRCLLRMRFVYNEFLSP